MDSRILARPLAPVLALVVATSQPLAGQNTAAACELPCGEPAPAMRQAVDSLLTLARAAGARAHRSAHAAGRRWNGRRVVSPEWIRASTSPSQTMQPRSGLLWWPLAAPGDTLRADSDAADVHGYYAEGFLGNYLVVIPSQRLVVVRMKRQAQDFERAHAMHGFGTLVRDLFASGS